jgi:hypothetical protein
MTRRKKYRHGFEPDKSTRGWLGRRVRALPGSGGWDGEVGVVVAEEVHPGEFGWFRLLYDRPDLRAEYPAGILTHSTEVGVLEKIVAGLGGETTRELPTREACGDGAACFSPRFDFGD